MGFSFDQILHCLQSFGLWSYWIIGLASSLARDGIVFSYASFSRDYNAVEKQAAVAGRGLWQAEVMSPAEFRRQKRQN